MDFTALLLSLDRVEHRFYASNRLVSVFDALCCPHEIELVGAEYGRRRLQEDVTADRAGIEFVILLAELCSQIVDHQLLFLESLVQLLILEILYLQQLIALLLYPL